MEKSLKRLHEDKTPPAKRKKPRLATKTSGPEEVEENQSSDEDTRALCGPRKNLCGGYITLTLHTTQCIGGNLT